MSKLRFDTQSVPQSKLRFDSQPAPPQNYQDVLRSAKAEIDRLNASQQAAGREMLSAGAQTALTDQFRQGAEFNPRLPQMDELNQVDYGAARNRESQQSPIQDFRNAAARGLGSIGPGLVGLVDPATGRQMQQNLTATYGDRSAGVAGIAGSVLGATGAVVGAIPAGPVGMAALYGASGAGATRVDIADRRANGAQISRGSEIISSTLIGGAEGLSGLITGGILNKAKGLVVGTGVGKIGVETARKGIVSLLRQEAPDLVREVGEEMATQLVTNAVRKNTYADDQELTQGVLQAGLMAIVPVLGAKGVAKRLQAGPRRTALTAQERNPAMIDSRHDYLRAEDQANALQEEGEKLGILKPESTGPKVGTEARTVIEANADAQVQAQVEAMQANGEIPPEAAAPVAAEAPPPRAEFPSRLETPAAVEKFFGTMEKDSNVLASYTAEPMVLVDIPVADIPNQQLGLPGEVSNAKLDTVRAGDPATQPPIMAIGVGKDNLFVPDGNHRVMVARERGDTSIRGYVPESLAAQRGYSADSAVNLDQEAFDAGVMRPTDTELTPEQRVQQNAAADAAVEQQLKAVEQQDADAAEVKAKADALTRKVRILKKPQAKDSAMEVLDAARSHSEFTTPQTRVGRMVKAVKHQLVAQNLDPETGALHTRLNAISRRGSVVRNQIGGIIDQAYATAVKDGVDVKDPLIMKGISDAIEGKKAPAHLKKFVDTARKKVDTRSEELATRLDKVGLKKQAQVIRDNKGQYLKEFAKPESWGRTVADRIFGPKRVQFTKSFGKVKRDAPILEINGVKTKFKTVGERDAAYYAAVEKRGSDRGIKRLEAITEQEREEKFIRDPFYRVGKTLMDINHDIETVAVLQDVAKAYGRKRPNSVAATDTKVWAEANGLVVLPEAGRLHALTDVYVPKLIASRLQEHYDMPAQAQHFYQTYLRIWKDSKTTKNPATHARNVLSNSLFFSTYAGVSPMNPLNAKHYAAAMATMKRGMNDPVYRLLTEHGAIGSEFTSVELHDQLINAGMGADPTPAVIRLALKANKWTHSAYHAEDVVFKLAKFHKEMAEHGGFDRAAAEVDYYFPNYNNISRLANSLRKVPFVGVPFAAFMDQSIRITGRTAVREPQRLATAMSIPFVLDQLSRVYLGVTDDEDKLMKRTGWGYFAKTFTNPIVYNPFADEGRDKQGAAVSLNMGSIVPLLNDIVPHERNGQLQMPWFATDPVGNAFREQMGGRDSFTGHQFVKEANTTRQNALARLGQLSDSMLPTPSIATSGRKRIMKAAEGRSEETLGVALMASLAGVNVRRDYIDEQDAKKVWYTLIEDGDVGSMIDAVDAYNESYRQGKTERYTLDKVFSGYSSSLRASRSTALKHATAELFAGNEKKAGAILASYNKSRSPNAGAATMQEAQAAMQLGQAKGRRY